MWHTESITTFLFMYFLCYSSVAMVSPTQATRSSQLHQTPWSHEVLQEQPELNIMSQVQLLIRDRTESFASVKANNGLNIQPCSGGATVPSEEHFFFGVSCKLKLSCDEGCFLHIMGMKLFTSDPVPLLPICSYCTEPF